MAKLDVKVDNGLEEIKLSKNIEKKDKKIKTKKVKKDKKEKKNRKPGFIHNVISELKLVTWTSKKNLVKYSLITIIMIILLALFFLGISVIFDLLYSLVQGWI